MYHMRKKKFIRIKNPNLIESASNGTIIFYGRVDRDYGRTYCFKTTDKYNPNYVDTFYIHDTVYYGEHDVEMFQLEYDRNGYVGMKFIYIDYIADLNVLIFLLTHFIWNQLRVPHISASVIPPPTQP